MTVVLNRSRGEDDVHHPESLGDASTRPENEYWIDFPTVDRVLAGTGCSRFGPATVEEHTGSISKRGAEVFAIWKLVGRVEWNRQQRLRGSPLGA